MKKLLIGLLALGSITSYASPAIDCYKAVHGMAIVDAVVLCAGAKSNAPVDCFKKAQKEDIAGWTSARATLCSGATNSQSPIDCYKAVHGMAIVDAVILCAGAKSNAPVDCFKKAQKEDIAGWASARATLCSEKAIVIENN